MTDLRPTIIPKSDQLNADDLIGQSRTIRVSKVSLLEAADQPIAIHFEGDDNKPFKPCKSMRRVLVNVWGPDGNAFIGRSMTLYRDEKVAFGGLAVGGIRISHMSHIDAPVTMALTASRASRKPFTVQPLKQINDAREPAGEIPVGGAVSDYADLLEFEIDNAETAGDLVRSFNAAMKTDDWDALRRADPGRAKALKDKVVARKGELVGTVGAGYGPPPAGEEHEK